jgi:hypothetical protein
VSFAVARGLFGWSIQALHTNGRSIISAGFGKTIPEALSSWTLPEDENTGIIASTVMSNVPQLVFSVLYMLFNNVVTRLFLAEEWSRFRRHRKGLRVSDKTTGEQRSTYTLTIPLRFGILLQGSSLLIHWLALQSIFFAKIDQYLPQNVPAPSKTTCGCSPLAIILTLVVVLVSVVITIAIGQQHTNVDMPLVGSCSRAIAAACHSPEGDDDPTLGLQ